MILINKKFKAACRRVANLEFTIGSVAMEGDATEVGRLFIAAVRDQVEHELKGAPDDATLKSLDEQLPRVVR